MQTGFFRLSATVGNQISPSLPLATLARVRSVAGQRRGANSFPSAGGKMQMCILINPGLSANVATTCVSQKPQ